MMLRCSCGPLQRTLAGATSRRPDPQCQLHGTCDPRRDGAALTAEPLPRGYEGDRIVVADQSSARIYCWVGDCWEAIERIREGVCDFLDGAEAGHRWAWVTRVKS